MKSIFKVKWMMKGKKQIFQSEDLKEIKDKYEEMKEFEALTNRLCNEVTEVEFYWNDFKCPIEDFIQFYEEDDELEKIRLYNTN